MRIDVLTRDGSPLGVSLQTLYGDDHQIGVGGAEQALLTLCEAWHYKGYDVTLYNNARNPSGSPFKHGVIERFNPKEDRDILIVFRSPNPAVDNAKGKKIWFSCDQYTSFPFQDFARKVDKVVCISPFHAEYFKLKYGIMADYVIDLPVRFQDYAESGIDKIPGKCIFTSVPYRGLDVLRNIWPMIHQACLDATLTITSDYRLWGVPHAGNEQFRSKWIGVPNVTFKGAVRRVELCRDQLEAQLLLYPCCLLPDTLVDTDFGTMAISNMYVGDTVLSGSGNLVDVSQTHKKTWSGSAVCLHTYIDNRVIKVTPEHKVLSISYSDVRKVVSSRIDIQDKKNILESLLMWKRSDLLLANDYVAVPRYKTGNVDESNVMDILPGVIGDNGKFYIHNKRITQDTSRMDGGIPISIPLDSDSGRLFGYILSEGSANLSTLNVTFAKHEKRWIDDCVNLGERYFGIRPSVYVRDTYTIVTFCSRPMARYFKELFGVSIDKHIHPSLMKANQDFLLGLMIGLWRGDGSVGKYSMSLVSCSHQLLYQVKQIMSGLGWCMSVRGCNKRFSGHIFSQDAYEFSLWVDKKPFNLGNRKNSRIHKTNDYFLIPITKIDREDYSGLVYDIGIADDCHSFSSGGIVVHNSYDELFCYAVAEAESVGTIPICHPQGAIETTNLGDNLIGDVNNPRWCKDFAEKAIWYLRNPDEMRKKQLCIQDISSQRFGVQKILDEWDKVFQCA